MLPSPSERAAAALRDKHVHRVTLCWHLAPEVSTLENCFSGDICSLGKFLFSFLVSHALQMSTGCWSDVFGSCQEGLVRRGVSLFGGLSEQHPLGVLKWAPAPARLGVRWRVMRIALCELKE